MGLIARLFAVALWKRIALFVLGMIAPILYRIFASLGIGFFVIVGMSQLLSGIENYVKGLFSQVPLKILSILGIAQVDIALNIIMAALSARLMILTMDKMMKRPMRQLSFRGF